MTATDLKTLRAILAAGSWTVPDVTALGEGVGTRIVNRLRKLGLVEGTILKVEHAVPVYGNDAQPTGETCIRTFGEVRYFVTAAGCTAVNAAREN